MGEIYSRPSFPNQAALIKHLSNNGSFGSINRSAFSSPPQTSYIRLCKRVMRLVDLRMFFPKDLESPEEPYSDSAHHRDWGFHVSAPNIYAEALIMLNIQEGQSFLLVGSGSGYFATLVGLLLGFHGCNHGIDIHRHMVHYAQQRVRHFVNCSDAIWERGFAPPMFFHCNVYQVTPMEKSYDRIYIACEVQQNDDPEWQSILKMLKVGGRMVAPMESHLKVITRTSEDEFQEEGSLNVAFAKLLYPPSNANENTFTLPQRQVSRLENLCMESIIGRLRTHVLNEKEHLPIIKGRARENVSTTDDSNTSDNHNTTIQFMPGELMASLFPPLATNQMEQNDESDDADMEMPALSDENADNAEDETDTVIIDAFSSSDEDSDQEDGVARENPDRALSPNTFHRLLEDECFDCMTDSEKNVHWCAWNSLIYENYSFKEELHHLIMNSLSLPPSLLKRLTSATQYEVVQVDSGY